MKTIYALLLATAFSCFVFLACTENAEPEALVPVEKKFNFIDFDKLDVSGDLLNILVVQADSFSIRVEGHAPHVDHLLLLQDDDKLSISLAEGYHYHYPTFVRMTMPQLTKFKLQDDVSGLFEMVNAPYIEGALADESSLNINGRVDTVNVSVSDESSLTLAGIGNRLYAIVKESSYLLADAFFIEEARFTVSEKSYVEINASDTLTIDVNLKSKAYYHGSPSINSTVDNDCVFGPK